MIEIRSCTNVEEYQRCVELQREVWGFADVELVPKDIIAAIAMAGGQVFGAYSGKEMIGFLLAFPGYAEGRAHLHSHMLAVLPAYRDRGVGRQLKLRQREEALTRGLELVEWTFDPLELKNAYFNLERLGAIARRYVRNKYGRTTSPLHGGLPTDRLVAEWWLRSARVEAVVRGGPAEHAANPVRIRVPANIAQLKRSDARAAEKVQSEVREQFEHWFGQGYAATGFELDKDAGAYLLEPYVRPLG
ncbi:MAG TPA: GNAT family N-acetyltransferase [Candidatus Xenobia bacterium]|nr:GNAT family N-acetyltransferase [Candidatus Xenobia bacterium]